MRRSFAFLACALVAGFASTPGNAAAQDWCAPIDEATDATRLLRQLSLDLLHRPPTIDELTAVADRGAVSDDVILEMLESDEYRAVVRDYHRRLLFGNIAATERIVDVHRILQRDPDTDLWFIPGMRVFYRGTHAHVCLDVLQRARVADGRPLPLEALPGDCLDGVCPREGYELVRPYWAPDREIKVCAFDAQANLTRRNGRPCGTQAVDAACGCGPGLAWCSAAAEGGTDARIRASLAEEPARIFEELVAERASYLEAFATRRTWLDGAAAHYYRHLTRSDRLPGPELAHESGIADAELAFRTYEDTAWQPVLRGTQHTGVLTTAAYLYRFPTHRARAAHFYEAFVCDPFLPASGGLPEDMSDDPHPNLRARPGCDYCHDRLDRVAVAWARWRTGGRFGWLPPASLELDVRSTECLACDAAAGIPCSPDCNELFVTAESSHPIEAGLYGGFARARAWLSDAEAMVGDIGPRALVDEPGVADAIAACTVARLAEHLLGRPPTDAERADWLPMLAVAFRDDGYDFTELVFRIVSSERYRLTR